MARDKEMMDTGSPAGGKARGLLEEWNSMGYGIRQDLRATLPARRRTERPLGRWEERYLGFNAS
jgi:hypothetical protein